MQCLSERAANALSVVPSFKQLRAVEPSLQAHPTVSFPSKDLIFK